MKLKQWWVSLLLGFLYIGLGVWMLRTPLPHFELLSMIFGGFILLLGLFWTTLSISSNRILSNWGWLFAVGLIELLIGIPLLLYPTDMPSSIPILTGFLVLFGGILAISSSLHYKHLGGRSWAWTLILGFITIPYAVLLLAGTNFAGIKLNFMILFCLFASGVYKLIFGLTLRKLTIKGKKTENTTDSHSDHLGKALA
ncbi:HdeD family acid-resistance protein [Maribacter aestuarii]|uniref:HdeD family acid-resistance protein n=1 Tax=Maribacter aestuarii TaxID=1130723 RepID=UPI00248CE9E3|nr:DUF308 domain-containing protein [Maribacter aestuarii]